MHDHHLATESLAKTANTVGVRLDGDHPSADIEEGGGDRPVASAYVQYQAGWRDVGFSDETARPRAV